MKYIYTLAFVFCLSLTVHAQTIKTDEGRRVTEIDSEIHKIQLRINEMQEGVDKLLVRYTPEYRDVVAAKAIITELQNVILKLEAEKKVLASKELKRKLPNTDVELLKIIALQNERMIDLLEQLVKRP